ncbi:hypothetical protein MKW94_007618 [Papaver nudicaule]|uniref:Hydroxyphenylpyruvate reductase n=1 Tax=Papaver nudicaule TaxID=74823 RepID=A0AA41VA69_PAPNU|nr:hypothetical protein [Papaver nudicaule]
METIGVLMLCPKCTLLEEALDKKFKLFRFWDFSDQKEFLKENSNSIRAIVRGGNAGVDEEQIDSLPKLEIISSFSVGLNKVDLAKCKEKGIRVTNTPDVSTEDVADLAIGLMLATLRRICQSDRYFSGKRVGILGLGRIGSAIAKRAEAFSCPVSYYSRNEKPFSKYHYHSNILDLASNCDILVVACPLSSENHHIIDREVMDALGPKGVLINIGRGPHVDEVELVSALVEGRLGGAGLDVFKMEPQVPEQLFSLDNVVLQPHAGSGTWETRADMGKLVIMNLEAHFLKKPLLTAVV